MAEAPDIFDELRALNNEAWHNLGLEEQDRLADALAITLRPKINELFEQSEAPWLIVGNADGEVLHQALPGERSPSRHFLHEIAAQTSQIPFVFLRYIEVDTIEPGSITQEEARRAALHTLVNR